MRIALLLAWRSLASKPGRSFTAILGIAIGIATVLSIQVVDHNTILSQALGRRTEGLPDVEMRPLQPGLSEDALAPVAFRDDPSLEAFCALFFNRVELKQEASVETRDFLLCGVSPLASTEFDAYALAEGTEFSGIDAREALLPQKLADSLSLSIGDEIDLQRVTVMRGCEDGKIVRKVTKGAEGDSLPFRIVGTLEPRNLGARECIVVPFLSGATIYEGGHLLRVYWGRLAAGAIYQDLRERIKSSFVVEKPKLALIGERVDQRAFRKSISVTSTLALLLGLFVIYNAFSMALVERVREIGLLRALGLKRGEIAWTVFLEGGFLAFLGALAGLLLTGLLVQGMKLLHITTLGYGKPLELLEVPWGTVAFVCLLGMLFALIGVLLPLLRARRLSVVEALRAGRLAMQSDPGFALRVALFVGVPVLLPLFYVLATPPLGERQDLVLEVVIKIALVIGAFFLSMLMLPKFILRCVEWMLVPFQALFPIETQLARAAIRGSRQRVLSTLTGLSVVVAAIFCVRGVIGSFLTEYESFSDRLMQGRLYVRTQTLPLAMLKELESIEGVDCVISMSAEVLSPFQIRGVRLVDVQRRVAALAPGTMAATEFDKGETLLLSRFLADSFGYRVGDEVPLSTFSGTKSFRVGLIADEFGYFPDDRSFALLEASRMEELFCVNDDDGKQFIVELGAGANPPEIVSRIRRELPPQQTLWVRSDSDIKSLYLLDRRRDFWVFDVTLIMTACLAAAGLLNSMAIAILERRREIALLRTIGITQRQVRRLVFLESLSVGLLGGVIAAGLALVLSRLAVDGVRIISRLEMFFEVSPRTLFAPLAAAVAVSLLAAILPAMRATRLPLGKLARHE